MNYYLTHTGGGLELTYIYNPNDDSGNHRIF